MKRKSKKTTKRSKAKYPALIPELNLRMRYEEIADIAEYAKTLPEKEKAWLNQFMSEYINCDMDRKNLKNNLHNTKELKQDCDRRNNKRKEDLINRMKAAGKLDYWEDYKESLQKLEADDKLELFEETYDIQNSDNEDSNTRESTEDFE